MPKIFPTMNLIKMICCENASFPNLLRTWKNMVYGMAWIDIACPEAAKDMLLL